MALEDNSFSALDELAGETPAPSADNPVNADVSGLDDLAKPKPKKLIRSAPPVSPKALTQSDLEHVLRQAGWPEDKIPTMGAIGMAESAHDKEGRALASSYNPGRGPNGPTTEQSIGPWQINMHPSLNRPYDRTRLANDPVYNAKVALELYNQRQKQGKNGLTHWGAYTDGRYKQYLGKGGDNRNPLDDLSGDSGYSLSGAPEVKMGVGGLAQPPAPSPESIKLFQQMFGKTPAPVDAEPQHETPDAEPDHEQLPPAPETIAPAVQQLTDIGNAAKAGQRYGAPPTAPMAPPTPVAPVAPVPPVQAQAPVPQPKQPSSWLAGTTPPRTPLPNDPALQQAYQQRLDQGIPDSEELRQKFLQGYQAVKTGQQASIFTPEDRQALDQTKNRPYSENDFAQWAAYTGVPTTPDTRAEFEKELAGGTNASVQATADVGRPTDQTITNPAQHYDNTTVNYDLRNKPANQTNKEYVTGQIATKIADQYGVPYDIAKQVAESQPLTVGGDKADEQYFGEIAKSGGVGQTQIGGAAIRQAVEAAARQKDVEFRTKQNLASFGDDPTVSPVASQMAAQAQATGKPADDIEKEQSAYTDWLKKTGYDDPQYRETHSQEFATDRAAALKQFGSFSALQSQAARSDAYYKDKPYSIALGMGPEYDSSVAASQLYNRTRLSDQDLQNAKELGAGIKGYEKIKTPLTGSFASQFITTALADLARMGAGGERILKYSNPLIALATQAGSGTTPEDLEQFAKKSEIVGETAEGDGAFLHYTGMAGKGAGALPGLAIATATAGGNPILGFGVHSLLSNTDKPIAEQIKGVAADVALGTVFEGAGAFGRFVGSKAAGKFLTPEVVQALNSPAAETEFVDSVKDTARSIQARVEQGSTEGEKEAARNVLASYLERKGLTEADLAPDAKTAMNPVLEKAMRQATIAKTLAERGTSIGSVGAIGYTTAKLEGQSDDKSIEQALLWGGMDALMGILHKSPKEPWTAEDIAQASEHIVRVPDADGKPRDILFLANGDKLEGHDVTGEVPPDAADAQILPKPGEKSIEQPSKNDWYKDIEKTAGESDLAKPVGETAAKPIGVNKAPTEVAAEKPAEPITPMEPERKAELLAAHKEAFTLPPVDRGLSKKMDVTYENAKGDQVTRQMTIEQRQKQLQAKKDLVDSLLDCIHG